MKLEKDYLDKVQSIFAIVSSVAIPIVIALVGWWVQASISNESIKKDYVQMAISILKDTGNKKDEEIRKWAVAILDKNSPIPFSRDLRDKLENGYIYISVPPPAFPEPPEVLMKPPLKFKPYPDKEGVDAGEVLDITNENYKRFEINAATLEYLQKWVMAMKSSHEKYFPKSTESNSSKN